MSLTCKDRNVIYLAQCSVCKSNGQVEDTYIGQTSSEVRQRFSGHRSKFKIDDNYSYSNSALSQHCFNVHPDNFNLNYFKVGFFKKCPALQLDREEHRLISIFRTDVVGLNRIKVIR